MVEIKYETKNVQAKAVVIQFDEHSMIVGSSMCTEQRLYGYST